MNQRPCKRPPLKRKKKIIENRKYKFNFLATATSQKIDATKTQAYHELFRPDSKRNWSMWLIAGFKKESDF